MKKVNGDEKWEWSRVDDDDDEENEKEEISGSSRQRKKKKSKQGWKIFYAPSSVAKA